MTELHSSRRTFLQAGAAAIAWGAGIAGAEEKPLPRPPNLPAALIDTHTHFYDPTRPQGVPWPGKNDKVLYRKVLPEHYREFAVKLGVSGTIVVEASPWIENNQWVLDLAAKDKLIVGLIGHLNLGADGFANDLKRFAKNPLFRGLRSSGGDFQKGVREPAFVADLKQLAEHGLTLDVNGWPGLLADVAGLARELPELRVVVNHMGGVRIDGREPPADWLRGIEALAKQPLLYMKVSALVESVPRAEPSGKPADTPQPPTDLAFYKPVLDAVWNAFGEDRLLYGSNWPVSERFAPYETVQRLAIEYFQSRGKPALEKFCFRNAQAAYNWPTP